MRSISAAGVALAFGLASLSSLSLALIAGPAAATTASDAAGAQSSSQSSGQAQKPVVRRFVVDQADMLNEEGERRITTALARLFKQQGTQVVVVTVDDLRGQDISAFSQQLAQHWQVAVDAAEPGMLIVVAPHDQKVKLLVGPGLEAWMPPEMVRYIIANYMFPSFSQRAYQDGVINGTAGVVAILGQERPIGPKLPKGTAEAQPEVVRVTMTNAADNSSGRVPAAAASNADSAQAAAAPGNTPAPAKRRPVPVWLFLLLPLALLSGAGGGFFLYRRGQRAPAAAKPLGGAVSAAGFAA